MAGLSFETGPIGGIIFANALIRGLQKNLERVAFESVKDWSLNVSVRKAYHRKLEGDIVDSGDVCYRIILFQLRQLYLPFRVFKLSIN
jgi:hypothetical protein